MAQEMATVMQTQAPAPAPAAAPVAAPAAPAADTSVVERLEKLSELHGLRGPQRRRIPEGKRGTAGDKAGGAVSPAGHGAREGAGCPGDREIYAA